MREGTLEERASARGAEVGLGILFLLSAANAFLLCYVVPKFEQIFADTLPGKPLPGITDFIIDDRIALILFVIALPILTLIMFWQRRRHAIILINLGIIWFLLQGGFTVFAIFVPMAGGIITGMPDVPLKPGT